MVFFAGGGLFHDSFCKDISFIAGTWAEAIAGYFDILYETFFQNTRCQGYLNLENLLSSHDVFIGSVHLRETKHRANLF